MHVAAVDVRVGLQELVQAAHELGGLASRPLLPAPVGREAEVAHGSLARRDLDAIRDDPLPLARIAGPDAVLQRGTELVLQVVGGALRLPDVLLDVVGQLEVIRQRVERFPVRRPLRGRRLGRRIRAGPEDDGGDDQDYGDDRGAHLAAILPHS